MTFTIYSKPGCKYCKKFQAVCDLEELPYVMYELNRDFNYEQFYEQFGEGSTFPQIVMGDIHLGGCQDAIREMQEKKICCEV